MELMSVHLSVCYLNRWDRPPPPFNSALENDTGKKKEEEGQPVHILSHIGSLDFRPYSYILGFQHLQPLIKCL